jgi:hypothetical protein
MLLHRLTVLLYDLNVQYAAVALATDRLIMLLYGLTLLLYGLTMTLQRDAIRLSGISFKCGLSTVGRVPIFILTTRRKSPLNTLQY